jgi:co-chaperonin GroES (HSP10)
MIDNKSGLTPVGVSILVLPEQIKTTTESGIELMTASQAEREQLKQTDGVVIAIGPRAFYDELDSSGKVEPRCKVGDRVVMIAYAGMVRKGNDNLLYRLVKDDDIIGILEEKTNE